MLIHIPLAIEAVVTTSTGNTYTETGTYQAVIRKLTPELGTKPETNILEYQKPLSDCVLKGGKSNMEWAGSNRGIQLEDSGSKTIWRK